MFEIPQIVFDTYNAAVDAMIDVNFGISCNLIFPSEQQPCPNCSQDTMTGKSANQYNGTGPQPFQDSLCPYCNGDGFLSIPVLRSIKLRCYFTPKHWLKMPIDVKIPEGAMQTFGYLSDLPDCQRAEHMTVNTQEGNFGRYRYQMYGEPVYHGFQKNRYFMCFWTRIR